MGHTEEPEQPGDTPEVLDLEPEHRPVSPPATPPTVASPRAPEPVAPRVAPRSALWWVPLGVLTMGSVGFMAGFIGPIILTPSANQGPLLGIFYTGPTGVALGFVLGIVCAVISVRRPRVAAAIVVLSGLLYAGIIVVGILRSPG